MIFEVVTDLDVGGAERVVLELVREMHLQGQQAKIVHLLGQVQLLEQYPTLKSVTYGLGVSKRNPFSLILAMWQLSRQARNAHCAVLHAHMFHALLVCLGARLFGCRIPIIFTSHSFEGFGRMRRLIIRITRRWRFADVTFGKTQHPDINALRTVVIPNGITLSGAGSGRPPQRHQPTVFISVGRLTALKNHGALIQAFARLENPDTLLWLVGEGEMRQTLEQQVRELELEQRVTLWGLRDDTRHLMSLADCFVLPSKWEGLPMVVLEAADQGLPVIATPVGALPELLGEGCGYLCPVERLTGQMADVLADYPEACARGQRLYQKVSDEFNIQTMTQRHLALYMQAMAPTHDY